MLLFPPSRCLAARRHVPYISRCSMGIKSILISDFLVEPKRPFTVGAAKNDGGIFKAHALPSCVSTFSARGRRQYMEDEFFVSPDSCFFGVFDGHGGPHVSRYLRDNIWKKLTQRVPQVLADIPKDEILSQHMDTSLSDVTNRAGEVVAESDSSDTPFARLALALKTSFASVENGVLRSQKLFGQGSTAVSVCLQDDLIISMNIGDSRAVLSRNGQARNLTRDHKPNCPIEKRRIKKLGGRVVWVGRVDSRGNPVLSQGCFRVNGQLAVARAVGDAYLKPAVSGEAEVLGIARETGDEFIVLASDGLWDVMSSQDAVSFVHKALKRANASGANASGASGSGPADAAPSSDSAVDNVLQTTKRRMARALVEEALRRHTFDNVSVVVVWL